MKPNRIFTFVYSGLRGILYFLFYRIRFYSSLNSLKEKPGDRVAVIRAGDISYKLSVHPVSGGLEEDVLTSGIREYPNVYEFRKFLEGHSGFLHTYIDAGANIGFYAVYASKIISRMKAKAAVYAIEPVSASYKRLKKNIALNSVKSVRLINSAVGDRDGKVSMIVEEKKNLSRVDTVSPEGTENTESETVNIMTLQSLFRKFRIPMRNVVLRWDIEGYEYELVTGNLDFFNKLKKSAIIMEFHPFYLGTVKTVRFLTLLEKAGFSLHQVVSCEPLYFLHLPDPLREFAKTLFRKQFNGPELGVYHGMDDMKTLKKEFSVPDSALYHYPNLHLYLIKD